VVRSGVQRPWSAGRELRRGAVDGAKLNRSEIHRGVTVSIFMHTNQFTDQRSGDKNQLALPFNLAVAADPARFEVAGIERIFQAGRVGSRRGRVDRRRYRLAQRFMRPFVIELVAEVIEALLLGGERGGRRLGGFRLEVLCMRSCRSFCWGWPGIMRTGVMPSLIHHTDSRLKPPAASEAKGGPLSESTTCGKQHSRKSRSNARRQPS